VRHGAVRPEIDLYLVCGAGNRGRRDGPAVAPHAGEQVDVVLVADGARDLEDTYIYVLLGPILANITLAPKNGARGSK
jgi:hypothetical protein